LQLLRRNVISDKGAQALSGMVQVSLRHDRLQHHHCHLISTTTAI
jgi:hypothetical protein